MAVTQDPATQAVLNSMVMLNMDGEGVHQLKEYFRKQLLMAGAIKPTDEEKAMMDEIANQEQKPDPQAEYLMAQAAKAMADADKAKAEAQATMQDNSPEAAQAKSMAEAAKYQADAQKAEIEAQTAREAQDFEREKMQRETEKQIMELAARRQELEMQLEIEAVKGQASIDVAQSTKDAQLQGLNQQIEDMATKMQVAPAQPIVIQSGGKTFTIQRTPNGYKGQIQE
jgi:murein DD-endopeptidase MepM/ murein hydrolase activator NlpD